MNNSEAKQCYLCDLKKLYPEKLIESLQRGEYSCLRDYFSSDDLNNWEVMSPILYAVRNEYNTYIVYKYCGEKIQENRELASEIIINEVELIEGTPLSRDREFIKSSIDKNPEAVLYMSNDLKNDTQFLKGCLNENIGKTQIENLIKANPNLAKDESFMLQAIKKDASMVLFCDNELKSNYESMEKICRENDEVIDCVVSNTDKFGKEGLRATEDVLIDKSSEKAIDGFKEELERVKKQIEQAKEKENNQDELKKLLQRSKQLERHIRLFEKIKSGEIDSARIIKRIGENCNNIDAEYRQKIEQVRTLDNAIIERESADKKAKKLLESGVVASEEIVTTKKINDAVGQIRTIYKDRQKERQGTEEKEL